MNSSNTSLPPGFAELERWVPQWSLPTERARYFKLLSSSLAELRPFFEAMLARADAVVALLASRTPDSLTPEERRLYDLLLTFIETAHPIELKWRQTDIEDTVAADRLMFHGPSAEPYR